jgi:hypothetical protein
MSRRPHLLLNRPLSLDFRPAQPQAEAMAQSVAPADHDALSTALRALRVRGVFACRSLLRTPWALTMPAMPGCVWLHAVLDGACHVIPSLGNAHVLRAGEAALLPLGDAHRISDGHTSAAPVVTELPHVSHGERYAV